MVPGTGLGGSARVTRLVTDLENFEKISGTQLVPGTGLGG